MSRMITLLLACSVLTTFPAQAGVSVRINFGGYGYPCYGAPFSHGCHYYYGYGAYPTVYYGSGYYPGYIVPGSYDDVFAIESPSAAVPHVPVSSAPATPPAPAATAPASTTPAGTTGATSPNPTPYGFDLGARLIRSPWSGFVINAANKPVEQVVYDANTGQAFRIPPAP